MFVAYLYRALWCGGDGTYKKPVVHMSSFYKESFLKDFIFKCVCVGVYVRVCPHVVGC